MLNKNEIIEELKNEKFIVRDNIYEHVCRLHLYDDKDINKAFIEFLKTNYNQTINYCGLIHSKLNEEIIEVLIDIHDKEEDSYIKSKIEKVLVSHYSIIKKMDYNFEEIIKDKDCLLMYKKIKHFCNKDPKELYELYTKSIDDLIENESEDYIKEKLVSAMGSALIQTEKGARLLTFFAIMQTLNEEDREYFFDDYIPFVIYPLCEYSDKLYNSIIQQVYYYHMDFIGYGDECNYYFSNICDEEFINKYIEILEKKDVKEYYFDICEFLKSETLDLFLLEKLHTIKDKKIKENIIRILASKFDSRVITYAVEYLNCKKIYDEEGLKIALAALFIVNKYDTDLAKQVIEDANKYYDFGECEKYLLDAMKSNNFKIS